MSLLQALSKRHLIGRIPVAMRTRDPKTLLGQLIGLDLKSSMHNMNQELYSGPFSTTCTFSILPHSLLKVHRMKLGFILFSFKKVHVLLMLSLKACLCREFNAVTLQ
ncbi:hypothetical protein FKM82_026200 [Ascaphus truei]